MLLCYLAKCGNVKTASFHSDAVLLLCQSWTSCCLISSVFMTCCITTTPREWCSCDHDHIRFTALFLGPPGWAGARRELLDFMVQGKINWGRHTDHQAGRHFSWTNHSAHLHHPPFLQADAVPAAQPTVSKCWRQLAQLWPGDNLNVFYCFLCLLAKPHTVFEWKQAISGFRVLLSCAALVRWDKKIKQYFTA